MATTVQAWGKILDARSRHETIPDSCAVDKNGAPTSDPFAVHALLPAAGPKGYGLMMMIDVLSGILLNLPFGRQVSSMYDNLSQGRELGRDGRVEIRVDAEGEVWIGGQVQAVIRGSVDW